MKTRGYFVNMNAGVNVKEFPIKAEVEGREGKGAIQYSYREGSDKNIDSEPESVATTGVRKASDSTDPKSVKCTYKAFFVDIKHRTADTAIITLTSQSKSSFLFQSEFSVPSFVVLVDDVYVFSPGSWILLQTSK